MEIIKKINQSPLIDDNVRFNLVCYLEWVLMEDSLKISDLKTIIDKSKFDYQYCKVLSGSDTLLKEIKLYEGHLDFFKVLMTEYNEDSSILRFKKIVSDRRCILGIRRRSESMISHLNSLIDSIKEPNLQEKIRTSFDEWVNIAREHLLYTPKNLWLQFEIKNSTLSFFQIEYWLVFHALNQAKVNYQYTLNEKNDITLNIECESDLNILRGVIVLSEPYLHIPIYYLGIQV